jgi:hypothetical protein
MPSALTNMWPSNRDICRDLEYNLRDNDDIHIPRYGIDMISRLPYFNLSKLWDQSSPLISQSPNEDIFTEAVSNIFWIN